MSTCPAPRERSEVRGGLPIRQLHKVEDYVSERLVCLYFSFQISAFQLFPRAGLSPLQFETRERITRAQQMMRESRAQPDREWLGGAVTWTGSGQVAGVSAGARMIAALEVGYASPSAFAQVFRPFAGVTPTEFRSALQSFRDAIAVTLAM